MDTPKNTLTNPNGPYHNRLKNNFSNNRQPRYFISEKLHNLRNEQLNDHTKNPCREYDLEYYYDDCGFLLMKIILKKN